MGAVKLEEAPTVRRVLSVDLAYKRHADIGVALLEERGDVITATLLDVPLDDPPHPSTFADWLHALALRHAVAGVAIDGPLGWKAPDTDAPHCRVSERVVRAPGKTGLPPDGVKPRTYLAFTVFSIALFERLIATHGFRLPGTEPEPGARFVTETFPTAAWRALGLPALPGKGRCSPAEVAEATVRLRAHAGVRLEAVPSHDQLQAVVGGLAPLAWAAGRTEQVRLAGLPPRRLDDGWREGYIMVPASR